MLAPLGLRVSPAKTRVTHTSEGFHFLGFRIQWRRKRGTNQWYVYTFIADRPLKAVKAKIRATTQRPVASGSRNGGERGVGWRDQCGPGLFGDRRTAVEDGGEVGATCDTSSPYCG